MNRIKISQLADTLIEEYREKKINAVDINSVRKVMEMKLKNEIAQKKYNQYMNVKETINYFEDGK